MSGALRLRREDNSIAAFALMDGGSGNEVVTGSVRYGEPLIAQPGPGNGTTQLVQQRYCSA